MDPLSSDIWALEVVAAVISSAKGKFSYIRGQTKKSNYIRVRWGLAQINDYRTLTTKCNVNNTAQQVM